MSTDNEIDIFIRDNYSPEKQHVLLNSFLVIEKYAIEDYSNSFIDILSAFNDNNYEETILNFELLIKNILVDILKEHGFVLSDEASLEEVSIIAEAIIDIQNYDDKESINRFLETDLDDIEKISEILALVSHVSATNIAISINDINPSIFELLKQITTEEAIQDQTDPELTKNVISEIKQFKNFVSSDELIGFKLLKNDFKVLSNFDFYNRYLKNYVTDFTNIETVSREFYLVFLMSRESYNNPLNFYRKISDSLNLDIQVITRLNIALNNLHNEFQIYKNKTTTNV